MNRPFNDAEETLLEKMRGHLRQFAAEAGLGPAAPPTPEVLDSLWTSWTWPDEVTDDDRAGVVSLFGFGLGDYVAARTGMQWRIVSDEQGSDYALVHPDSDVTAFPLATVAKRLGQAAFFSSIAPALIADVQAAVGRPRPWWKFW